jgi:Rrf2 family nitric oxide-sensitive transcriptional repressor
VFRSLEADVPFAECFAGEGNECPLRSFCRLRCLLSDALEAFYAKLDSVTLKDLVTDNSGLNALLKAA